MEDAARVLVVDDDPTVAEVVVGYLARAGLHAEHVTDGADAVTHAEAHLPDLVVLDLMLPGMDGLEVCRRLRALGEVPVIMLTALGEESDRVLGLEVGADDYVTKPFSPRELVLRVQSVLRRVQRPTPATAAGSGRDRGDTGGSGDNGDTGPETLRAGDLVLDMTGHRASRAGQPLALTTREFDLLAFFLANPGRAFSRTELMERVWGWTFGDTSTVSVHVRRLREKIEADPANPTAVVTVWGVGYRFDPPR